MLVARACRALAVAGLFDMHGHISVREGDVIHINDRRSSRATLRPEQVAVVRIADGEAIHGEPPSETAMHLACYRARPDVGSVAHFHPLFATAFATAGRPLICAFNAGVPFGREVPVFDDPDLVRTDEQGRGVAAALADHRTGETDERLQAGIEVADIGCGQGEFLALLQEWGWRVRGIDSSPQAVEACRARGIDAVPGDATASLFLEESARRLAATIPLGDPRPYTDDELARVTASLWQPSVVEKTWTDALERARLAGVLGDLDGAGA